VGIAQRIIPPATDLTPGTLSALDKSTLDAATSSNFANAIVKRDASGNASVGTLTANTLVSSTINSVSDITIEPSGGIFLSSDVNVSGILSAVQGSQLGVFANTDNSTLDDGFGNANLVGDVSTNSITAFAFATINGLLTVSGNGVTVHNSEIDFNGFAFEVFDTSTATTKAYIDTNGVMSATSFTGNGANISNLNASAISSGTLANARLPSSITTTGDLTASATGSTTSSPRQAGISNLTSGTAARVMFGDAFNCFQTNNGGRMQIISYWGMEIYGMRQGTAVSFATGSSTDATLSVIGTQTAIPVLITSAPTGQTADLQHWTVNGSTLAKVDSKGNLSANSLIGSMDTMTYAATIALDTTLGNIHKTTTVNATGNATINASSAGTAGQFMWVLIANDATSGKVITFGTNFKSSGTLTGTASKTITVAFISDGTAWYETLRSPAV
jgi:hypothetical protein